MSYLDEIASAVRGAVPACVEVPDDTCELFVLYAVLVRTCGERTTARDVHDAWSAWMGAKDPSHPSLVPFEDLPPEVQSEDTPYVQAVRTVASRLMGS
jgi:hypothetical protein